LTITSGLRAATVPKRCNRLRPSVMPSRRRAQPPWRRRRRSTRGSRHVHGCGVAGRNGPADADTGCPGVVEEAADEVAALAGHADAPGRRVRRKRSARTAWPVCSPRPGRSAGEQDAEFVSQSDQFGLGAAALFAGLAVTGARQEGGLDPLAAQARNSAGFARRGCTRRRDRSHQRAGHRCRPQSGSRALLAAQVRAVHAAW